MRPPDRFHHSTLELALAQNRARYAGRRGYKNSGLGFVERKRILIRFVGEGAVAQLHAESKPARAAADDRFEKGEIPGFLDLRQQGIRRWSVHDFLITLL